jgi:hypothetical protein
MMRTLFSDRPQPFYGQADLVEIGTLTQAAVADVVGEGFARTGRKAGRLAGLIFEFAGGHPQRVMQLADACWVQTPPGTSGEEAWPDGLAAVRRSSADAMERLYSRGTTGEQAVLRSVARSGSVYGVEASLLDLAKGTARHARQALLDRGELVVTDSGLRIVDPVLADWVRYRFPV